MTRLDAIKARERATQIAIEFSGLRATYVEEDRTWLLAQVGAPAGAARLSIRKGCHDTCSNALVSDCACDCGHEALTAALAALEAPDA